MMSAVISPLGLSVLLSMLSVLAIPLVARLIRADGGPDDSYFSTMVVGVVLTAVLGFSSISLIFGLAEIGAMACAAGLLAYGAVLLLTGALGWRLFGPSRSRPRVDHIASGSRFAAGG